MTTYNYTNHRKLLTSEAARDLKDQLNEIIAYRKLTLGEVISVLLSVVSEITNDAIARDYADREAMLSEKAHSLES